MNDAGLHYCFLPDGVYRVRQAFQAVANAVKLSEIRSVIHISTGPVLIFCGFLVIGCRRRLLTLD